MKRLILFFVTSILLVSSMTSCAIAYNNINRERTRLDGKVLQTLSKTEALVVLSTPEYSSFIVKVVDESETFFDKKRVRGSYVRVGTYSYFNKDNIMKTVPVYAPMHNY